MSSYKDKKKKKEEERHSSFVNLVKKTNENIKSDLSQDDVANWDNSVTDVGNRAYNYVTTEGYKKPDTSLVKEIDSKIGEANAIGQYLRANKSKIPDYEKRYLSYVEQVNYLNSLRKNLTESNDLFSQFKSEKEYEDYKIGWLNPEAETTAETATARQERFKSNEKRKEEIDKDLPWYASTIMPNWMENWFLSDEKEKQRDEYETLKAENNQYKRTQSALDEYYTPETPELIENGAKRDYNNASKEDLWVHNTNQNRINELLSDQNHKWDENGNIVNITTGKIDYVADDLSKAMMKDAQDPFSGGFFDTDKDGAIDQFYNSVVQDKLGMFLSASEDDLADAYSQLSSHPTDFNHTWAKILQEGDQNAWKYLEEHELNIYYDLYKTKGQAAAYEYLDKMTTELTRRETVARQEKIDDASGLEKVLLNIASVPQNVFGGAVGFVEDAANIIRGEDINPYSKAHSFQNDAQYVRQSTAEDINELTGNASLPWLGYTFGDAYQALMSGADSAVGAMLGGNAYGVLMGMGAASSEMKDLWEKGADAGQIAAGGILAGAAEMVFEKYSIDQLVKIGDVKTIKQLVVNGLKQGGIEATEEMFTEVANTITNSIVMGSQSDWTDMETFVKDVVKSGLSGFISGGTIGGVVSTINYAGNQVETARQGQEIIDAEGYDDLKALALDVVSEGKTRDAKGIEKAVDKADAKTTAYRVGKLSDSVDTARDNQNLGDIQTALEEKGLSKRQAKKAAQVLNKAVYAEEITQEDFDTITQDEATYEAFRSLVSDPSSSVNTRNLKHNLARQGIIVNEDGSTEFSENAQGKILPKVMKEEGQKEIVTESFVENKYEVSADGRTINKTNDELVNIVGIESIKDGEMVLRVENDDGKVETVNAKDISFSNDDALIYSAVVDMGASETAAWNIAKNFKADDGVSAGVYAQDVAQAYQYGVINYQAGLNNLELTTDQAMVAFYQGRNDSEMKLKGRANKPTITTTKNKADSKVKGKVVFEGFKYNEKNANDLQKASMAGINFIAEMSPLEVHVYKSFKENGKLMTYINGKKRVAPNGYFVEGTNKIYIDINAGQKGEGIMLDTAGHEIAHYIAEWNWDGFKELGDFLFEHYSADVPVDTLIEEQKRKIKESYRIDGKAIPSEEVLFRKAYEETVADAMSKMLSDENAYIKLAELKKQNQTLWEKIGEAIKNLLEKIKSLIGVYSNQETYTQEAKQVEQFSKDVYEKLQDLYLKAFMDANETVATIGARNLADFAEAKNTEGGQLFQYRAMEADEDIYRDMLKKWGKMTDTQINNLFTTIDRAMDIIKDNLEVLDYAWETDIDDRAFSPVKPNSDSLYQVSLDFSTLCRKRILQQTIQAHLQEALNQPLSREEGIAIRDALIALQEEGRQIEVACALCYVESARMKSPAQIKKFLNNREAVLKDFFAGKAGGSTKAKIKQAEVNAREQLHKENPNGIKGKDGKTMLDPREASLKSMPKKYADEIRLAKKKAKESYKPTPEEQKLIDVAKGMNVSDFTSPEGLEHLAKEYPTLFDAYTSYVRNATKSKGIEGDTWWRAGDSQKIGDVLIANMNRENGLRSQSWSDFQVVHILDYIAATIELSTRNAKEQAYSKVPDYVELMGQTGVMINMSLIPTSKFNGSLEYDSVEGMDYKRSLELREKYPATAGTICIGVDNKQIQMLLADVTIDYVIPYHKSGMAASIRKLMHIPTWEQYEDEQNEKNLSREDAKAQAKKYGVTLLAEGDPNYHKHTAFSEWFDLEVAKQIAKMENANPTDKAMQKKYGVMYGGYMAMQNAANNYLKLCAERGIAPKFSYGKADFTVEDNYWKLLIDRKMINNATGEIIEQQTIKPVFDEGEVLRILNDELERYPSVKADQEYATRKVTEKFLSGEIKSGMSADAIAKVMQKPVDNITKTNIVSSTEGDLMFSEREIVGESSTNYGVGVYLDSNLLTGLTDVERKQMVKEFVISELAGQHFIAYDNNNNAIDIGIAKKSDKIKNSKNKKNKVLNELHHKNNDIVVKQEAIVLIDELIATAKYDKPKKSKYSHDWLDNYGKSNWDYWKVFIQEKNKTVWEATLNVANTSNGEKILYDIKPIKKVEEGIKSPSTATNDIIHQDKSKSQVKFSEREITPITSEDQVKLAKHFGTTKNYEVAGYMLKSGQMLDFSGKHWGDDHSTFRQVDHRDVWDVWENKDRDSVDEMVNMIGNGYIRLMPEIGGINLAVMPNATQLSALRGYINHFKGEIIVDVDEVGGDTIHSFEYARGTSSSKIIADIKAYFEKGIIPEQKAKDEVDIHQFLYQERDSVTSNRSILADALESAAQNDIEKNKLKQYKEKIALIEKEEQKLSDIQKKLFTKGAVEPAERKDLQFEARQISNRINTYDRQLLNLESTTALKNVLNREKQQAMKRQKQKDAEYLKQYKEKVAKTQRELLERNRKSRKNAVESRNKTAMRHKIQKVVSDLNKLLLKPTKERHVPEEMIIAVSEALSVVNMDTVGADERVAKYNDLIAKATDPDVIASLTETRDRILQQGNKLSEKLGKLKDAYAMVRDSADDSLNSMYDDVIYNKIESVQRDVGKTPIRNMSLNQLENVYDLYKMVLTTIRDSNKAFAENITMSRLSLGSNTFGEIKSANKTKEIIKHPSLNKFLWQNLKPMQAMKTIGSGTLQKLWNNILYGQETFAVDYDEAVKFAEEMKDKYGYKKWKKDKLFSFTSKSGKTMKLNLEQMMSIYAYSKREQADEHIEYGGIVLNEGVVKVKNKLGKVTEVRVNDSTAHRLDKMQVGEIIDTLEKEYPGAKGFVDEMQKYLSETMGAKGNEVSMKMYGVRLFKEEHYFPLKSSKDFMEAANAKLKGDVKIKNKGMTKATVEHAQNPIVLENFLDVWGNHINEMALYHGLVLPLEDFSRTLNYSFKADEKINADAESVRTALHDAFGDSADSYLNELLKAINGGVLHDSSAQFADKMISKFKKAKVMASLSVIVQQPTAIIRAMSIIEPKYFVAQNFSHKATWEELKKYCPTAIIKETGSFDTNMGRTIVDMIKDDRGFTDKVGDVLGKAPAYMDEVGWNMIWRALKKKVAKEQNLSGEALLKESGRQMTLILNETQVYDSVMSRNELMRSKNALTKMATSFMAEPSTVANMIYGAGLDIKRGKKGVAAKTVTAVITSVVINGLVSAMVYAMRDDDEEKTLPEKYLSSATTEVIDGLNPLTYIPFVKDIYSLFQGYKVERTDMALIKDVVDAVNDFYNVLDPEAYEGMTEDEIKKHIYENTTPLLTSICDMFGLPVGNILRDVEALFMKDNVPMSQATSTGTRNAIKEGLMGTLPQFVQNIIGTDSKQDKIYDAIVSGDDAYVERLKSTYKDDKAFETAVRSALRENDPRIKEAAKARIDGDIAEYTRIVKEIKAEGHFKSQDTIVAAINSEINAINKGEDTSSKSSTEDKASSIYTMDDYFASIVGGDEASANTVKEDIINIEVENGKDREDAESYFNSRFASHVREQYEEGYVTDDEAKDMLVNYGDRSEEDATSKVQYWAFKQENPDYDLSEEAVVKYYNEVEPLGVSVDVYYDYYEQRSKCKGTDSDGDGKTDSGSVKAEVLQVINSLPLTYEQKDALYYLNGWAASKIYEAPWH